MNSLHQHKKVKILSTLSLDSHEGKKKASGQPGHQLALLHNDLKSCKVPSKGEKILTSFPFQLRGTIFGSYLHLFAASTKHARGLHISQGLAGVRHHWRHCDPCWIHGKTGSKHGELLFLCGKGMSHTEIDMENRIEKACSDIYFKQQIYHPIHISSANHWKVREERVFLRQATTNIYIYIYI